MPRQSNEIRRQVSTLLEPSLLERIRPLAERQSHTPSSYIRAAVIDRVIRDEPETEEGVTIRVFLGGALTNEASVAAAQAGLPLQSWVTRLVLDNLSEL